MAHAARKGMNMDVSFLICTDEKKPTTDEGCRHSVWVNWLSIDGCVYGLR